MHLTPLTDKEFDECPLPESHRGCAYWDEEGWLISLNYHKAVLEQLKPNQTNARQENSQKEATNEN